MNLLCKMYNELDTAPVKHHLSRSLVYESQWVVTPITGSRRFYEFMHKKFEAVRNSGLSLKAVKRFSEKKNCEFIALYQGGEKAVAGLLIESENGLIKRIDLVIPELLM